MKTITISDDTAAFLAKLSFTIQNQDNRATANPLYFTIRKFVDVGVPDGCGDGVAVFDNHDCENYTEEQAMEHAKELEMDFEEYIDKRCHRYETRTEEKYEEFFFTEDGYNEHVRLNGHNIARTCKEFDSYVMHAYRNPEISALLEAVKEIGGALKTEEVAQTVEQHG